MLNCTRTAVWRKSATLPTTVLREFPEHERELIKPPRGGREVKECVYCHHGESCQTSFRR